MGAVEMQLISDIVTMGVIASLLAGAATGLGARTDTIENGMRWALEYPPNDSKKREEAEHWLRGIVKDWLDKKGWKHRM